MKDFFLNIHIWITNKCISFVGFISTHRLVVAYYYLNITIFLVGLTAVLWYNDMTAQDFVDDFREFKVLYRFLKYRILPEIFPEWFEEREVEY